ncbi:alpha-ketoglutarate-dependent dioxygenase AlkB [Kocuria sp. JC486]|uniref:alpha-ketoglutarate-dependent dioxygenase AlkB family protein n=1 Tax=Kocuria sp. JC486 TaxID=1970736 RepID=UPI001423C747|nr:alpha-ketoglutarate-dependent dioxygenase AlkB [Kocuria sp. JC486]NHU86052.1 alpha-ketoglutarate-dependent dioxygenase AlkB [Kocuria sp. JC486]
MRRPSLLRGPGGPELFTVDRHAREVAPGAVHVPDWLTLTEQQELVEATRRWCTGEASLRHHQLPGGGVMSVKSTVLGRRWSEGRTGTRPSTQTSAVLPQSLTRLGTAGVTRAYGRDSPEAVTFTPTTAVVNFYGGDARMGMHQDLDESGPDPIVSVSLGDACVFRLGNVENRGRPYQDVELRSGDLLVFGRSSRWAFHGVPAVKVGTGDPALGMRHGGRINITIRSTSDVRTRPDRSRPDLT